MIAVMNQGYINSKIPVRVRLHCIEQADLHDSLEWAGLTYRIYYQFLALKRRMPGDRMENLKQTADAAMLLIVKLPSVSCGLGNLR